MISLKNPFFLFILLTLTFYFITAERVLQTSTTNFVCASSCKTCSGALNTQCLSCRYQYYLQNGMCVLYASFLSDITSDAYVSDKFYMFWTFSPDNTSITMAFRWNTGGHVALGFGTSMSGMDTISAEMINNQIMVYDRWSKGHNTPPVDNELGGTNDVILENYLMTDVNGYSIAKFKRALNTGDRYDYVIKQEKGVDFCYSYAGTNEISNHGPNQYSFQIDFIEGFSGSATLVHPHTPLIQAHSIGLLICWSFLVDFAIIYIRYFRYKKNYIDVHALIFFFVDFYTLIIVLWVIGTNARALDATFQSDKAYVVHFALGIIVLVFLLFQHINGVIIKKLTQATKYSSWSSKLPNMKQFHRIMGFTQYLMTKACVLSGIWVYNDRSLFIGFIIYYGIWFIFRVILELIHRKYYTKKNAVEVTSPRVFQNEFKGLIKDIQEHKLSLLAIVKKYPNLKWCLLNNSVYNLKNFDHPGGKYIIEQIYGREIGRFFYGAYSLENTDVKPYNHSGYGKQLLDQMVIGELNLDEINILQRVPSKELKQTWTLVNKVKLNTNVSKIEFFSSSNPVKNHVKSVEWIGRHFTVYSSSLKKLRLYTTVLCYTEANMAFREDLITFFDENIKKNNEISQIVLKKPPEITQNLPLIIKRYDFPNTLSSLIHNAANNEKFEIQGHLGAGLELNANSNGNHIIFSGGTGILPFMDLFDFLLKKSIYHILLTQFGLGREIAEQTNVYNEDFENIFGSKFKVLLFAAFQNQEEFEYVNFILKLYNLNKQYNLNNFDMILKFSDKSKIEGVPMMTGYFDDAFFVKNVVPDQCNKIYICGNPAMNKSIPEICLRNQIDKEKICIV